MVQLRVLDAVARLGSVTAAAHELHYSQPSVSHQLGRLEAAAGARLLQRVGRGVRLTPEGELLARRASEIIGRLDAASAELEAHLGLRAGRVRVAGFQTVLSALLPQTASELARRHPGVELHVVDVHPTEALTMLQAGQVDIALIFRHPDTPREDHHVRLTHLLDDPLYLLSRAPDQKLEDHVDSLWVGGCERCRAGLVAMCERSGFTPRIAYSTDDMVVTQSLVAAGMGVATLPGLALRVHRAADVHATPLPGVRQIFAATFGDPPDPPATAAVLGIIAGVIGAGSVEDALRTGPGAVLATSCPDGLGESRSCARPAG